MAGLGPGMTGGHQHRGDGCLRGSIAVTGPVEQLGRGDPLGDQTEKAQRDVAGPQHRAGGGVVKPRWRLIERIL